MDDIRYTYISMEKQKSLTFSLLGVFGSSVATRVAVFPGDLFPGKRETNVSFPGIPGSRERF